MNKKIFVFAIILIFIIGVPILLNKSKGNNLEENEEEIVNSQVNNVTEESEDIEMSEAKSYDSAPKMQLEEGVDYKAIIKTSKGEINVDLFEDQTPLTVNNFVFLAGDSFYDGTVFHRIIEGFMIQGGDPEGTGMGGPGYKFDDEDFEGEYTAGTLAMANSGPNTNGSQFFIMHKDYELPKNYVIFGRADGDSLDVVNEIATSPVERSTSGEMAKPTEKITIESVEIIILK